MKGVVTALDQPGNAITIDGTAYTVSEGVVWPIDLATNDSVIFGASGTVISALDKIHIPGDGLFDLPENMKGLVTGFDLSARAIIIDGNAYTVSESLVWPVTWALTTRCLSSQRAPSSLPLTRSVLW